MAEPEPARRLSAAELKVLKIAAHRQLRRWNAVAQRGELHRADRRDNLRRAVRTLDEFPAEIELRATDPP
jgi:hypothetical protein